MACLQDQMSRQSIDLGDFVLNMAAQQAKAPVVRNAPGRGGLPRAGVARTVFGQVVLEKQQAIDGRS